MSETGNSPSSKFNPGLGCNISLSLITLLIGLFVVEYGLRLFSPLSLNQLDFIYDPHPGFWRKPDVLGYSNSFGMADKPRQLEKQPGVFRIALLGDSYMEWGGPTGKRMGDLIESYSNGRLELLNFGISSVGTVQELDIYRHHVRQFQPDLVMVALLTHNDLRNNHYELEMSSGYHFLQYASRVERDEKGNFILVDAPSPTWRYRLKMIVMTLFPSLYTHLGYFRIKLIDLINRAEPPSAVPAAAAQIEPTDFYKQHEWVSYGVYWPPEPGSQWEEAWQITEWTLLQFRDEVEADGADLVLVILSDAMQLFDDPRQVFKERTGFEAPDTFDPFYPPTRLAEFCKDHDLTCINLAPLFKEYKETHDLQFPYFSYPNDDHWDTLGHQVAADIVYKFIEARYLEVTN